jgi:protein FrlC
MKLAQSTAVYFNHSLAFALRDLHRLGYQGVEIWGGRPHMYRHDLDAELDSLRGLCEELGLAVCNFIPAQFRYPSILCSSNEQVRKDSVDYIRSAIDNAFQMRSPSVSVCPGMTLLDGDCSEGWRQLHRSLKEVERYAAERSMLVLIEPGHRFESNLIATIDECLRMLEELRSERFGILLDSGHVHLNAEQFDEVLRKCQGIPLHVHVDDNRGDFDSHLVPGQGNVDFAALFRGLKVRGYTGFVSVELGPLYNLDPTSACRQSRGEALETLMAQYA